MATAYFEKLKDPRWQKKRLEALSAAQWKCSCCGDTGNTLHVHHRQYFKGREPWDYEVGQLDVLCEYCHKAQHEVAEPDCLLLTASFVPISGDGPTRYVVASLIDGFCARDMAADYTGDPGAFMAGSIARVIDRQVDISLVAELAEAICRRDKWTLRAALADFINDLRERPDAAPPTQLPGL